METGEIDGSAGATSFAGELWVGSAGAVSTFGAGAGAGGALAAGRFGGLGMYKGPGWPQPLSNMASEAASKAADGAVRARPGPAMSASGDFTIRITV